MPRLSTMFAVAGGCGIGVGCMALLLLRERDKLTNQASFIKNAVQLLEEQPVTNQLLGTELKIGKASLGDGWSKVDKMQVKVRVPIQGENDKAYLYAYARRKKETEKFRLYKLEATFNKVAGKKLVFFDRTELEDAEGGPEELVMKENQSLKKSEDEIKKAELSHWEKRRNYIEQMKSWQPTR